MNQEMQQRAIDAYPVEPTVDIELLTLVNADQLIAVIESLAKLWGENFSAFNALATAAQKLLTETPLAEEFTAEEVKRVSQRIGELQSLMNARLESVRAKVAQDRDMGVSC